MSDAAGGEEVLSRWLQADSLDTLASAVYDDFHAACGLERLLIAAWIGHRPAGWACVPEADDTAQIQKWHDSRRPPRLPENISFPDYGVATLVAEPLTDNPPVTLGLSRGAVIAAAHQTCYEIFWRVGMPPEERARHGDIVGGPLWQALELVLANHARMEHLRELSHIDYLTGVFNRRYFNLRLLEEVARAERFGRPLALIIADLDNFKPLNDTQGHQVGDILLRYVGHTVRRSVRSIDILCRLGGDEFAVLMPDTDADECVLLGQRLCRVVNGREFPIGKPGAGIVVAIGLSLGGAVFPDHADRAERLLWSADMALLEAKRAGGNRLVMSRRMERSDRPAS